MSEQILEVRKQVFSHTSTLNRRIIYQETSFLLAINMSYGSSSSHQSSPSRRSIASDGSSSSTGSSSSMGSRVTTLGYHPQIVVIRETAGAERNDGKTVYIKRQDEGEERICSVWESSMYSGDIDEFLSLDDRVPDYWSAFNIIAKFILDGKIRLSGGRDCFKRLANPQPGVGTLSAGSGIYFKPEADIKTNGTIEPRNPGDKLIKAHISLPEFDDSGNETNRIKLRKGKRYLIRGDDLDANFPIGYNQRRPELLICHRGRLLEAGFEVPGSIAASDLWFFDREEKLDGIYPLHVQVVCPRCLESYANRKWPTPDVCEDKAHCDILQCQVGSTAISLGYTPALGKVECASCTVGTFKGRRLYFYQPRQRMRSLKRVLDTGFTIQDWDHLSEATGQELLSLAVLFCSMPSFGRRLNKKGASFVPWASDSGIILGDYVKLSVIGLECLFVVLGDAVVDIFTGQKIKFEEDENGITHVRRGGEDFSSHLPLGEDGYVLLG